MVLVRLVGLGFFLGCCCYCIELLFCLFFEKEFKVNEGEDQEGLARGK